MVLKFKKSPVIKTYYPTADLEGHIFIFGKIGCLDEETEIYTFNKKLQRKKLKELPKKFKVISYNFEKNKREVKDTKMIDTGLKDCYEIELENGRKVIATKEHKFFNERNEEVKLKDLKIGDELLCNPFISGTIGKTRKNGLYPKNCGYKKGHKCWHKGKTKKDYPQLSRKGNKNYIGWNKNLTKETDKRVNNISKKLLGMKKPYMMGELNPAKRPEVRLAISKAVSSEKNGMYGKTHSKKIKEMRRKDWLNNNPMFNPMSKEKHSKAMKIVGENFKKSGRFKGENNPSYGKVRYPTMYFSKKLGHKIRSSWEENVCIILKENKINYNYEPIHFQVDNSHTYTPDLQLTETRYIEIKGALFDSAIYKMKRFKKLHPEIVYICITSKQNFSKLLFCDILIDYNVLMKRRKVDEILQNKIN